MNDKCKNCSLQPIFNIIFTMYARNYYYNNLIIVRRKSSNNYFYSMLFYYNIYDLIVRYDPMNDRRQDSDTTCTSPSINALRIKSVSYYAIQFPLILPQRIRIEQCVTTSKPILRICCYIITLQDYYFTETFFLKSCLEFT